MLIQKVRIFVSIMFFACLSGTLSAATLTTTYAGGNGEDGVMFDIKALVDTTITGFTHHLDGLGTVLTIEIYEKTGTHVGSENISGNWTLYGSATVTSLGPGVGTPIPISLNIPILAGASHSFYITTTSSVNSNYTNGTAVGNVYVADGVIQILEGTGKDYPFLSSYTPRVWNGTVTYSSLTNLATIPTLSEWSLILLIGLIGLIGFNASHKEIN